MKTIGLIILTLQLLLFLILLRFTWASSTFIMIGLIVFKISLKFNELH